MLNIIYVITNRRNCTELTFVCLLVHPKAEHKIIILTLNSKKNNTKNYNYLQQKKPVTNKNKYIYLNIFEYL